MRELAVRELARRHFRDFLPYAWGPGWQQSRFSVFLADRVQEFLDTDTGHAYDVMVIQTPPQHGKLLADDTPVPTPDGWVRHGDLRAGDRVYGPDGRPVRVLAEIPQDEPASLTVTFSDGCKIAAHPRHEWVVRDRIPSRRGKDIILETRQMAATSLRCGSGTHTHYRYSVDAPVGVQYRDAELPLHPYFLGLWLGDGSTTKTAITHHPDDSAPFDKLEKLGYERSATCEHRSTGCHTDYFEARAREQLHALGFGYPGCESKHIPEQYKVSSQEQRLELLAGMIDSDGYVYQRTGRVTISNTNRRLIDDFAEVVRSLGWRATISAADPVVSTSGIAGKQTCYQLTFSPDCIIPTALERKRVSSITPARRRRSIVAIEPCAPTHGKCITVEGGVYLAGETMIPTHNSWTVTASLPAWQMMRKSSNVIIASYNDETAERFCRRNKDKCRRKGRLLFEVGIGEIDRSTEFELTNGSRLISRGLRAGITGNPADLIILDDPIKNRQEADSEAFRAATWEGWQSNIKTRLSAGAKVVAIMTPWHEDDICQRIIRSEPNAQVIRLPVEAEADDPMGRAVGEPLCPELRKDAEWVRQFKASYISDPEGGARAWRSLFQCSPRVEEGNLIKRGWWRYTDTEPQYGAECISVDAAFKGTDTSDYVAITVWGKSGIDCYCRYCLNRQMDFTQTLEALRETARRYPSARAVLIEDKANGSAIINVLSREMYCIPVNPLGGKEARLSAVSPSIESGHVWLLRGGWTDEMVDQFCAFPTGKHDDIVDSASQALNWLAGRSGAPRKAEPEAMRDDTAYSQDDIYGGQIWQY